MNFNKPITELAAELADKMSISQITREPYKGRAIYFYGVAEGEYAVNPKAIAESLGLKAVYYVDILICAYDDESLKAALANMQTYSEA